MVTDLAARLMKSRITRIRLLHATSSLSLKLASEATSGVVDSLEVRTELGTETLLI